MKEVKKKTTMPIVNHNSAGIDVGSKSHFIAVGQGREDVKEFAITTKGHNDAISFLKTHRVKTVAMESTGSYWQTLFFVLQEAGFEVLLVDGHQTKNARKKTDVKDCQWIQKLHSMGLLSGCFLPSTQTLRLRNLARYRISLVESCAKYTNKIQKTLRLMNIRLDVAIRDIAGKSGRAIIESIIGGERNADELAKLVDCRVKKSKEEISEHLQGQWDDELLYELSDCYSLLNIFNEKIKNCDIQIEKLLIGQTKETTLPLDINLAKKQTKSKHACNINISQLCYKTVGVDIMAINGVGPGLTLSFISEMGLDIHKFPTAKQFTSWLRLTPNNRISGGRILSSRTGKTKSNLTKALKDAANAVGLSKADDQLTIFFRKIAFKKGRGAAITATARKIAAIIWNMIVKKVPYNPLQPKEYLELLKQRKIKFMKKDLKKHGITITELSMA